MAAVFREAVVAFQQGGRLFASRSEFYCNSYGWTTAAFPSLTLGDFVQLSGHACAAGESCPDFSGSGGVIQLGFARRAALAASEPGTTIKHDVDNCSVHIWRR